MPDVASVLICTALLFMLAGLGLAAPYVRQITQLVYGGCCAISLVLVGLSLAVLLHHGAVANVLVLPMGLPGLGANFQLDALSAFFLLVISIGGAAASLYAIGYSRTEQALLRVLPFYPAFLAGMALVVVAADAFTFLLTWEFMSLVSWALVVSHHEAPANIRAGFIYLVMASFGTLCLLLAFGLLAGASGDYGFAAMRASEPGPTLAAIVALLVLVGAGSKAGIVPLHVWLPLAHPAAPSHVSALLSGVMTKVGIYAFIRIVFDLVGDHSPWAGLIVLTIGGITAVMGVLYALMQHDLKRLLAYHTVENIGIIFIGVGLALAFRANGQTIAAALAMTAALFHVFNHMLFKSLLFFGAGAVQAATGERDMEKLGGLIHVMPQTAIVFLIGCAAISALPPLNGFVSEWLTFQAILVSPQLAQWSLKFVVPTVGALLALAAALAAACFVKVYGVVFLGRPRTPAAANAQEVDRFSLTAMFALAALCVFAGILPSLVIDLLSSVTTMLTGASLPKQVGLPWLSIVPLAESRSSYNGLIIFAFLLIAGTTAAAVIHRFATRATRRSDIWDCGFPLDSPVTQYSSSSFAMPIRRVFGASVFQVIEQVDMPQPGEMRAGHFQVRVRDPAWRFAYGPLARAVMRVAQRLNQLQFLTVRSYLTLVFSALIALLLVVAAWR